MKSYGKHPSRKSARARVNDKTLKRGAAKKRTATLVRRGFKPALVSIPAPAQPAPILAHGSDKDLTALLTRLETAQLVRRAADEEIAYLFKHALTQEAAYGSLLHQHRREIHRRVAETYERFYPDRLDEFAALLAQHYAEAGDDAKTLDYSIRAGDVAARVYAHAEAIAQYTRALQTAVRSASASDTLAHIYERRGRAFELAGDYPDALANYEEMEQLGGARGDRALELQARLHRATVYIVGGSLTDFSKGNAIATDALQLARELGDKPAEAKAYWNLMIANRFGNEGTARAIEYGEQSAAIARELDLREQLAYTLHDVGLAYQASRQYDRSLAVLTEVVPLWRALDNQPLLTDALNRIGGVYYAWSSLDQARHYAEEAYALNHSIGNAYGLVADTGLLAGIHAGLGQLQTALEFLAECERYEQQAGAMLITALLRVEAAQVFVEVGAWERAHTLTQHALLFFDAAMPTQRGRALAALASIDWAQGNLAAAEKTLTDVPHGSFDEYVQAYPVGSTPETLLMLLAEFALARGDLTEATRLTDELLNGLERTQTRRHLPLARTLKAKVLLAQNQVEEARTMLTQARAEAEATGVRHGLPSVLIALSQVEARLGNAAEAQAARTQARQVIDYIAAHAPADVRESFLALPDVRGVMDAR